MNTNTSQARIFADEYAKNAGREMLNVIDAISKRASLITKIALGVSMPHQIGYILALAFPYMHLDSVSGCLEAITMICLAIGVPIATDLLILNCVETIGAAAASRSSKIRAFVLMFIPVAASGTVNFLAPAPMLIKVLAAFIVAMVPMAQSLRFVRPDFAKIEQMQTAVTAQLSGPAVDPVAEAKRQAANVKRQATIAEKNRVKAAAKAARAEQARLRRERLANEATAPVSPAWVIENRQPTEAELAGIAA